MELQKDFKEFIALLNGHQVKYLVVGGYAVNFHGYPRYTKDIDLWIWLNEENAQKMMKVLKDFGFEGIGLKKEDFMNPSNIIQLGFEPNRIDLLVDVDGLNFDDCFPRKKQEILDGVFVNFISIEDLILAKRVSGRLQDLADAEQLYKIKKKNEG